MHMTEAKTPRLYDAWAVVYDYTFGLIAERCKRFAMRELDLKPGHRVLEVGIGTGMALRHYPDEVDIVGLDISEGMLREAESKVRRLHLDNCQLVLGDALHPPFENESFDHVVLCHTISVVSDPAALMRRVEKLVKPGGHVTVINHFHSTQPVIAWFEKTFNPIFVKIGWKSDLSLQSVLDSSNLTVERNTKPSRFSVWRIVTLARHDGPDADAGSRRRETSRQDDAVMSPGELDDTAAGAPALATGG